MPPSIRIPTWVRILGWLAVSASVVVAARLVWEQTFLTWRTGLQMVGFSLAHGYYAPLLLAPVGLLIWIVILIVFLLFGASRRRTVDRTVWVDVIAAGFVASVFFVPYETWQLLFASRVAHAPRVGEFVTAASYSGNRRLIEALVSNGVPIDVRDVYGNTALHTAAAGNHVDLLGYLLERGVPIDAVDRYGDSALERAHQAGSQDAVAFLVAHGAHRVTGTLEQRQKATEDFVRERSRR